MNWDRPNQTPRLADFESASGSMPPVLSLARKVAASEASLLLLGETGVGKERMAQAIHQASRRSAGPFLAINCAALSESLIESELFGHEEGAFTGALRARRGCFELADGGTLFLDEIAELPVYLQAKLLRVLQEREIRRVGAERSLPVDVRVMSASNRDLHAEVEAGRFRKDLYYRISVVTLTLPPLRERREDIPGLIERFWRHYRRSATRPLHVEPKALAALRAYDWPGNVRELMNVIERTALLAPGDAISADLLPDAIAGEALARLSEGLPGHPSNVAIEHLPQSSLRTVRRQAIDAAERAYLVALLQQTGGRVGETARRAGVTARAISARMRRFGLCKETFRTSPRPVYKLTEGRESPSD